jgi:hypothetical protein
MAVLAVETAPGADSQQGSRAEHSPSADQKAAVLPEAWEPPVASRNWKSIVLHHSATAQGDIPSIDAAHRRLKDRDGKPWLGIAYHFVIGNGQGMEDGEVQPTFRWQRQLQGAHAGNHLHNEYGIGICLIGDFNRQPPTAKQMAAVKKLVAALANRYGIGRSQVVRHLDIQSTECPGRLFPFAEVVAGLNQGAGLSASKPGTKPPTRPSVRRAG